MADVTWTLYQETFMMEVCLLFAVVPLSETCNGSWYLLLRNYVDAIL